MKITFILPGWITKNNGGAEWQTYLLSEEFVKRGWNVSVVTSEINKSLDRKYLDSRISYHYYPLLKIKTFQFFIALYFSIKIKTAFYYTRTDDRIFRAAIGFVCKISKRKMIYALAGDDELFHNKYHYNGPFTLKSVFRKLDYLLINQITRKSENRADVIISQTQYQKEKLKEYKGLESVIIPNSYIPSEKTIDIENKENIILWVGNMRPVKRPEVFLEIAEKAKHLDYRFVMIGGNTEYLSNYRAPDNIEILGSQSKEETLHYFKRAKFLINTSQTEGFSNTFLEAWDTGVRIISLNVDPDRLLSEKGFGELCLKKPCVIKVLEKNFDNDVLKQLDAAKKYLATYFNVEKNFKMLEKTIKDESTLVY